MDQDHGDGQQSPAAAAHLGWAEEKGMEDIKYRVNTGETGCRVNQGLGRLLMGRFSDLWGRSRY